MKKVILFTVCLMLLGFSLVSAELIGKGVKVGLNIASLTGDDVDDELKSKMGLCLGGYVTYSIDEMFSIQPELLYTQKGFKFEDTFGGVTWTTTGNINYIEIPVLVKLNIPVEGSVAPSVFLGPVLAIKMSATWKTKNGITDSDDMENVKSTDFGLVLGGGVDIDIGASKLTLDIRYNIGLSNISEIPAGAPTGTEEDDMKNSVLSFMVGYAF